MKLASRTAKIDSSGIRKVFDLAAKLENPCNLSIGQPHFDVPEPVKDAAILAIRSGKNSYTPTQGTPELRERVRRYLEESRRGWTGEELLITSGTSGGILLSLLVTVEEGDEVIITDPYFVMYKHLVNLCMATPVFVDTYPDFKLSPQRLEDAITDRTKLVFINSPNNPTGAVYSAQELAGIAAVLDKHGIYAVTDEIYEFFCYDGEFASLVDFYPERTLLLGGFSKTWSMTGWRLGYAAGPPTVIAAMTKIQQYTFVCAPSVTQAAGVIAFGVDVSAWVETYRKKRDHVVERLSGHYELSTPGGAFYAFPKVPEHLGLSGTDFVKRAVEKNLLVIPGDVFSERDTHFRLSYACDDGMLDKGLDILVDLAK